MIDRTPYRIENLGLEMKECPEGLLRVHRFRITRKLKNDTLESYLEISEGAKQPLVEREIETHLEAFEQEVERRERMRA